MAELGFTGNFLREDTFFHVACRPVTTSAGPVDLPTFFVRWSGWRLHSSTPIFGVAAFDYRATTVGEYGEVGIAVPAVPANDGRRSASWREMLVDVDKPRQRLGFHILYPPVATAIANAGGREIWGFPKFVTPIDTALTGRQIAVEVHDPEGGTPILQLKGSVGVSVLVTCCEDFQSRLNEGVPMDLVG